MFVMRMNRLVLCLIVIISSPIASATTRNLRKSRHNATEVQQLLDRLNKPPVKSIQSPDGDIIDCILIHEQPAFDHPLSKNHTFQMRPSSEPKGQNEESNPVFQTWKTVNETCPDGTVPIRRTTEEDLLRTNSLTDFGKKYRTSNDQDYDNPEDHEHAIGILNNEGPYYGIRAFINLWSPNTEPSEFSLAQIWILAGSDTEGTILNTIEAGWQIYPEKYGDNKPRFFTYWTSSAYGEVGCYNMDCPGFYQVAKDMVVGQTILDGVSQYGGRQSSLIVKIWKEDNDKKWWLSIGDGVVGYWPSYLFKALADKGEEIHVGGEVVNLSGNGKHTVTEMGSGHFADEGFTKAAYIANVQLVDHTKTLVDPKFFEAYARKPDCYSAWHIRDSGNGMGHHMYFGGPGRNKYCP